MVLDNTNKASFNVSWNYPTSIRVGADARKELPRFCEVMGVKRPLIVTDPGLVLLPVFKDFLSDCRSQGLEFGVFSKLKGNPVGANVTDGVAAFKKGGHDGVVALGGGSALDTAKAIALMVGQVRPLWDFEDEGNNWLRVDPDGMVPVVAIPTTAGTGSEVGRASVITDERAKRKVIIFHPDMLPSQVILDPILCLGLPPAMTAATGMDALSHSLEAYCTNFYHPMAEGIALESMRLVATYLPRAFKNGQDIEARQQMLVASAMGATAFQRGLGGMHALAHSLGALYDSHHGLLNAVLMPYVLIANRDAIHDRIVRLARFLDLDNPSFDGFIKWLLAFRVVLSIPSTLKEIGIDDQQLDLVGEMASVDPSAGGNPVSFSATQYQTIFRAALDGEIDLLGAI